MQEELVTDMLSVSVKYLWPLNPEPLPSSRATMTCPDPTRTQSQSGLNSSVTAWSPGELSLSGQDRDTSVIITFVGCVLWFFLLLYGKLWTFPSKHTNLFDLHPRDTAAVTAKEVVVFTGETTSHKPLYELHRWLCVSRSNDAITAHYHQTTAQLECFHTHIFLYFLFLFLIFFSFGEADLGHMSQEKTEFLENKNSENKSQNSNF